MLRQFLLALILLFFPVAAQAQSQPSDSQTLQALLSEVRQLRQQLLTSTTSMQRSQILLHRLDLQELAVQRATQRRDEAQEKLTELQKERKDSEALIKQATDSSQGSDQDSTITVGNTTMNASQAQALSFIIPSIKARLESLNEEEQQAQTKLNEADEQLRIEQSKLADLQDQLDRLDRSLSDSAH